MQEVCRSRWLLEGRLHWIFRAKHRPKSARNQSRLLCTCQWHTDVYWEISTGEWAEHAAGNVAFAFGTPQKILTILHNFAPQTTGDKCQIINLGCGFDTLYWRLRDQGHMITNFIELDFPTVTSRKCYYIKRNKHLLSKIHTEGTSR